MNKQRDATGYVVGDFVTFNLMPVAFGAAALGGHVGRQRCQAPSNATLIRPAGLSLDCAAVRITASAT